VEEIGCMKEKGTLLLDGGDNLWMAVPDIQDTYSREKIYIFFSINIPEPCSVAFGKGNGKPFVSFYNKIFLI
jgi:hypothetical protein